MAFTYDFTSNAPVANLRLLVQDTTEATAFLQDEEITALLAAEPNINRAAARACRVIAARLARQAGFKNTTVIYDPTEKAKEYRMLAEDFDRRGSEQAGFDVELPPDNLYPEPGDGRTCNKPAFTRSLHLSNRNC